MTKKYTIEVYATHKLQVWGESELEAIEKAQTEVFEEIKYERGDLITGYKVI